MKKLLVLALVLLLLGLSTEGISGQYLGGIGYLHTNSARTLPQGALSMSFFMRGYVHYISMDEYLTHGSSALSAAFGYTRHSEFALTQVLYQDLNHTKGIEGGISYMVPGDAYFRFKFGNYTFKDNFYYGVMPVLRYRGAKYHDIHLEPYKSLAIEAELMLLGAYYQKPLYPDEGFSAYVNLGYVNHNDAEEISSSSQSFQYLVSFMNPQKRYDYGLELYGSLFLTQPGKDVLGRENWMYVTPMVRYRLFKGLHFTMGFDVLVMGNENTTVGISDKWGNYSKWRLSGRVQFTPSTAFYSAPTFIKADAPDVGRQKRAYDRTAATKGDIAERQALFRWALEERTGDLESVDVDLEKIRRYIDVYESAAPRHAHHLSRLFRPVVPD